MHFSRKLEVQRLAGSPIPVHMTTIAPLQNFYKTTATRAQDSHYVLYMGERRRKDPSRGERLGNLRLDVDKSAIHVAREIGVSKGRIYAWENGDPINSENLDKLADALDTSLSSSSTGPLPIGNQLEQRRR